MNTNTIIALVLFAAVLAGRLIYDVHLYLSSRPNRHVTGPAITAAVLVSCSCLAGWLSIPMWFFSFAAVYDPAYAVLIGQKAGYLGNAAAVDRMQHRYPFLIIVKYAGAAGSIILFILFH